MRQMSVEDGGGGGVQGGVEGCQGRVVRGAEGCRRARGFRGPLGNLAGELISDGYTRRKRRGFSSGDEKTGWVSFSLRLAGRLPAK